MLQKFIPTSTKWSRMFSFRRRRRVIIVIHTVKTRNSLFLAYKKKYMKFSLYFSNKLFCQKCFHIIGRVMQNHAVPKRYISRQMCFLFLAMRAVCTPSMWTTADGKIFVEYFSKNYFCQTFHWFSVFSVWTIFWDVIYILSRITCISNSEVILSVYICS